MGFNPLTSLMRFMGLVGSCRLRFPRDEVGRTVRLGGAGSFTIFRHAAACDGHGLPRAAGATFTVRFHVATMSVKANKYFSLLTIPFFAGLPGFCSKRWLVNEETDDCAGIYGWATRADAERYAGSFAMRFMTRRSVPGSVSYEIRDTTEEKR